jgi:hypothetical protein
MGLNVFTLFVGFGLGSLVFGGLIRFGFGGALGLFAAVELIIALLSFAIFHSEVPARVAPNLPSPRHAGPKQVIQSRD